MSAGIAEDGCPCFTATVELDEAGIGARFRWGVRLDGPGALLGATRVIGFTRAAGNDRLLVVASLCNQPFLDGYVIQTDPSRLPDGLWREVFNSDAAMYGGRNVGNFGADVPAAAGRLQARIPACGFIVFQKL